MRSSLKANLLLDVYRGMNRLPREPEDESNEIVETEGEPDGRESEGRVNWGCYEGMLGVKREVDTEL